VTAYKQAHGGSKPPIDVLAMHLYNFDLGSGQESDAQVGTYLSELRRFRQEADSLGYRGVPIWITELGFYYPPGGPLSDAHASQDKQALKDLIAGAQAIDLQRVFLLTSNQYAGLRPLYDPGATLSPTTPLPLTEYGQIVANLVRNG